MKIWKPHYFDTFSCIASRCPDSCCKEWSVTVDEEAASRYRALPGDLGDRLRQVLTEEDGDTVMAIENGRCPMWREDGLCRIQAELGHDGLCQVCRDFPRLRHDYGDFVELGLELSCPEAAKFILNAAPAAPMAEEASGGGEPEYDPEAMAVLKATRGKMLALLSDGSRPVGQSLALGLLYGYQAQSELDGSAETPFDPDAALEEIRNLAKPGDPQEMLDFFLELELLTPQWKALLRASAPSRWDDRYRALARYLVQRYWLQAVSDYDLYSRVKFIIIACLLVRQLGGDLLSTAQLFS